MLQGGNGPQQTVPSGKLEKAVANGRGWLGWLAALNWKRLASVAIFSFICVAAVSFALLWQFENNFVSRQQVGESALADVLAPRSLTYVSAVKTKELGDQAASNPANRVYRHDTTLVANQRDALISLLNLVEMARTTGADISLIQAVGLDSSQVTTLLNLPDSTWASISQEARAVYSITMNRDILPGDLNNVLASLRQAITSPDIISPDFAQLAQTDRELTVALVRPFIKTNNVLDEAATRNKQDDARKAVGPAEVTLTKGTPIVRRGDIITALQIEELEQSGLRGSSYSFNSVAGTVGITASLILLLVIYCTLLAGQVWTNPRWLFFLAMVIIVSAITMRILLVDVPNDSTRPYLLPLAAVAMVIAALFDVNLALFVGILLALLAGMVNGSPELVAVFFVGSAIGALTLRKADHTSAFAYGAVGVAISQFVVGLCSNLLLHNLEKFNVSFLLLFSLINGFISGSLAFFCFSILGKLFGVATSLQLLELAHPNQPLLRRLIREAPGTYHHSILVSNLAEQAAERLEDNALLARVGSYYHDIGKLTKPVNFIDNQGGGINIHDTLDPRESVRVIKAHVTDGVALARKHKLPRRVVDIIHQHHGTCLVSFFYQKALKMGLDVNEIDFHYPGPKPQTKVAAIVMLADGCEAAVRANVQSGRILTGTATAIPAVQNPDNSNPAKNLTIRDVVNKIVDDRIRENQLSECDLTLRDVEEIRNLFVEILTGIYHPRIIYPDKETAPVPAHEMVVNGSVREIPNALVPVAPEPASRPTPLAVGSNGKSQHTETLSSHPAQPEHGEKTKKLNPGKTGIGGAGRKVGDN